GADGDDELVEAEREIRFSRRLLTMNYFPFLIDTVAAPFHEPYQGQGGMNRFNDTPKLDRSDGGTGKQRGEKEEVAAADDADVIPDGVDFLCDTEPPESGPQDDERGPLHVSTSLPGIRTRS